MTDLTFDEYQKRTHETAVYGEEVAHQYTILGLVNEAGEVAGKLKKMMRGDELPNDDVSWRDLIGAELGDVLWYASEICNAFGLNLSDVAEYNLKKLQDRKNRNVIRGDGDRR